MSSTSPRDTLSYSLGWSHARLKCCIQMITRCADKPFVQRPPNFLPPCPGRFFPQALTVQWVGGSFPARAHTHPLPPCCFCRNQEKNGRGGVRWGRKSPVQRRGESVCAHTSMRLSETLCALQPRARGLVLLHGWMVGDPWFS